VIVAMIAMLASTVVGGVAPAPAQDRPPPLTPKQALRIVNDYDRKNARNNDTLDLEGQAMIETPPIQPLDDATFREYEGRGKSSLNDQRKISQRRVFVPEQAGFPLQFLASERSTSPDSDPITQLLLFVRPTEGDRWKVSMAATIIGAPVPKLLVEDDGFARLLDADHAAGLVLPPAELPAAISGLWSRAAAGQGGDAAPFAPGPFTTDAVANFINVLAQMRIDGRVDFAFAPHETPQVCYRATADGALCFFAVTVTEIVRPTGATFVQPRSRQKFGGLVVPGEYVEVRYERLAILAAVVPNTRGTALVDVVGIYDGVVSATATPSSTPGTVV
jgi:hypothetical protein